MAQEARQESWRIDYLVENHIRPGSLQLEQHVRKILNLSAREFAHWYYIMVSSSATIFLLNLNVSVYLDSTPQ